MRESGIGWILEKKNRLNIRFKIINKIERNLKNVGKFSC